MRRAAFVLAGLLVLTGCGDDPPSAPEVISTPSPEAQVLQAGKGDVTLQAGTYYSPVDFVPPLAITVPEGWQSTHRGDDAFDLGSGGAIVVFDTPDGETVAPALAALRAKVPAPTPVTGTLAGEPATGFEGVGGSGPWLASPSGTIALDLAAGQRVRVLGADVDGVPLLAVVLVPGGGPVPAEATALLGSTARG